MRPHIGTGPGCVVYLTWVLAGGGLMLGTAHWPEPWFTRGGEVIGAGLVTLGVLGAFLRWCTLRDELRRRGERP